MMSSSGSRPFSIRTPITYVSPIRLQALLSKGRLYLPLWPSVSHFAERHP
jgi:hypothetical protein